MLSGLDVGYDHSRWTSCEVVIPNALSSESEVSGAHSTRKSTPTVDLVDEFRDHLRPIRPSVLSLAEAMDADLFPDPIDLQPEVEVDPGVIGREAIDGGPGVIRIAAVQFDGLDRPESNGLPEDRPSYHSADVDEAVHIHFVPRRAIEHLQAERLHLGDEAAD